MDPQTNSENPLDSGSGTALPFLEELQSIKTRGVIADLRMAHVHQWQGDFENSTVLYQNCVNQAENLGEPKLLGLALYHQGKNFFDQKKFERALKCFYDAFSISLQIEDSKLHEDSRFALQKTLEKKIPYASQQIINKIFESLVSVIK